jgi:hypothetical protein
MRSKLIVQTSPGLVRQFSFLLWISVMSKNSLKEKEVVYDVSLRIVHRSLFLFKVIFIKAIYLRVY